MSSVKKNKLNAKEWLDYSMAYKKCQKANLGLAENIGPETLQIFNLIERHKDHVKYKYYYKVGHLSLHELNEIMETCSFLLAME